ncbi:nucleotidyltransferase domain-containing protein [Paenibacillus piri]|uniref:nucleotidyltransferase domain-containing protein n=1 Tax=Paenibacillus piri TaxID=2547395 RepID=UPI001404FDB7|nr:hypothetical protein [Paenibacillus piri]
MESLISQARIFFDNRGFIWSVCGGRAIDLFLGKQTRVHKDLDIAVFWEDRNSIIALMLAKGWKVFEACGGGVIRELFDKQEIPFDNRNLFCFTANENRCRLDEEQKQWLRESLEKEYYNDHVWLQRL